MTTADAQATVGGFVKAIAGEQLDDARALLHHEFVVYEAGGLPYSGEYHGPDGFFELLGKMNQAMELTPGETFQYLLADDTVAIRGRLRFTSRASRRRASRWVLVESLYRLATD